MVAGFFRKLKDKSRLSLLVSAIMLLYITFNLTSWKEGNMLQADSTGYYLYLPATIIYNDLGKLEFYTEITYKYYLNGANTKYGLYPQDKTGYTVNKYAVGVSLLELPFFLIAHAYCLIDHEFAPDGYSQPYRVAIVFAYFFWVMLGLIALRKVLLRYFSEAATGATLLLIMFGTNLYFYIVFSIGMSHPVGFALFCFLLYYTSRAYDTGKSWPIIMIGAIIGLITIIRPTNLITVMIPVLWPHASKLQFFRKKIPAIIIASILFACFVMIQLGYLKYTSGEWFHFSYQDEGFTYLKPEIYRGLFSYRKGWFVYTPIAFVAVLGLIPLAKTHKKLSMLILGFLLLSIYIVFSWYQWFYGGGFGCRPLIETMAVMAIPLAAIIQYFFSLRRKLVTITMLTILSFFIALNTFQSYQLINNVTMWDGTTKAFYWRSFGKLITTDEDRKLLNED